MSGVLGTQGHASVRVPSAAIYPSPVLMQACDLANATQWPSNWPRSTAALESEAWREHDKRNVLYYNSC
jgi:hypothetical protein